MAEFNIKMRKQNEDTKEWDILYPKTKAKNVTFEDGETIQEKLDLGTLGGGLTVYNEKQISSSDETEEEMNLDIDLLEYEVDERILEQKAVTFLQDQIDQKADQSYVNSIVENIVVNSGLSGLPTTGGTMTGNINFANNETGLAYNNTLFLRKNGANTVLSAENGGIYFHPCGNAVSTNRSYIDKNGDFYMGGSLTPLIANDKTLGTSGYYWKDAFVGACSKADSGYTKLTNGMIMQWSYTTVGAGATSAITFPIAFTSRCLSYNATPYGSSASNVAEPMVSVVSANATTINIKNHSTASMYVAWQAIGY